MPLRPGIAPRLATLFIYPDINYVVLVSAKVYLIYVEFTILKALQAMDLAVSNLKSLKRLLRNARELIDDAQSTAHAAGDGARAARIKDVSRRIDDELDRLDAKLVEAERAGKVQP